MFYYIVSTEKESTTFRPLAASFDEKIGFGPKSNWITFLSNWKGTGSAVSRPWKINKNQWKSMEINGNRRKSKKINACGKGNPQKNLEKSFENLPNSLKSLKILENPWDFHENLENSPGISRISSEISPAGLTPPSENRFFSGSFCISAEQEFPS